MTLPISQIFVTGAVKMGFDSSMPLLLSALVSAIVLFAMTYSCTPPVLASRSMPVPPPVIFESRSTSRRASSASMPKLPPVTMETQWSSTGAAVFWRWTDLSVPPDPAVPDPVTVIDPPVVFSR